MAQIPLRPYLNEIESLIEKGQIEEAIDHCRHVLQYYPKNLATYRLLGKAYLEVQRYNDASDIFLRILSSVPDDFVSHVGMSIIREDEGNQDSALWHMERAFEVQPYNSAIQDELRRLYGWRDGFQPPKVRLTRGGLARMYAKGDLHQQAIGELRAALSEDPQRPDLQVLLARMYFLSGQRVEAVEVCSKLIKKLPYCLEANRILAAILPETERKGDAERYQLNVAALDPYLAKASPQQLTAENVPDNAVMIEKLVWIPGQAAAGKKQPEWAASLGIAFQPESTEEQLPDWLSESGAEEPETEPEKETEQPLLPEDTDLTEQPFSWEEGEPEEEEAPETGQEESGSDEVADWLANLTGEGQPAPQEDESLPDWMKEAGWELSSGETPEAPPDLGAIIEDDSDLSAGAPLPGDVPDWLKAMAPPGTLSEGPKVSEEEADEDVLSWLSESSSEGVGGEAEGEETPDWLASLGELGEEAEVAPGEGGEAGDEVLDWLSELEPGTEAEEGALEAEAEEAGAVKADEIPEWLSELEPTAEAVEGAPEAEAEEVEEVPEWLSELEPTAEAVEGAPEAEAARMAERA
jgi:tetratricopeptide (TPR) repeat protein